MKRLAIIVCVLCVLVQPLSKQGILVLYHLNKAYIASELCENRLVPESGCQGKCHLRKALHKDTERGKQSQQAKQGTGDIIWQLAEPLNLPPALPQSTPCRQFPYQADRYTAPDFSIFHPPCLMA